MKLDDIGSLAALVLVITFLVFGADKLGIIKLRADPPAATETTKK